MCLLYLITLHRLKNDLIFRTWTLTSKEQEVTLLRKFSGTNRRLLIVTQWLVHVSFTSVTGVLVTQRLVHVSFTSVTEVMVTQWLVHVSFTSVTGVLVNG